MKLFVFHTANVFLRQNSLAVRIVRGYYLNKQATLFQLSVPVLRKLVFPFSTLTSLILKLFILGYPLFCFLIKNYFFQISLHLKTFYI